MRSSASQPPCSETPSRLIVTAWMTQTADEAGHEPQLEPRAAQADDAAGRDRRELAREVGRDTPHEPVHTRRVARIQPPTIQAGAFSVWRVRREITRVGGMLPSPRENAMKAYWIAPGSRATTVELRDTPAPEPKPGEGVSRSSTVVAREPGAIQ